MSLTHCHDVIVGIGLLQHQVHGSHVVGSMAPVPPCFKISKSQLARQTKLDLRRSPRDLSRHKFKTTPWAFVVEEQTAATKHSVSLAVVPCQFKAGHFTDSIRTAWMKGGGLFLGYLSNLSEHLA